MGELQSNHKKYTQDLHDLIDTLDNATRILNGKIDEEPDFSFLTDTLDDVAYFNKKIKSNPKKYYSSWFSD